MKVTSVSLTNTHGYLPRPPLSPKSQLSNNALIELDQRRSEMLLAKRYVEFGFCVLATIVVCESRPVKRQVSIDELIHSALSLVRPIFDTSQAIQDSPVIPRKMSMSEHGRETQILGVPQYSNLMEVPICRGNSQICRFISCTAHNFKHDDNFANLNLAAQLLEDKKMRQTIASNPDAVVTVCHEQGLSIEQCRLFSRGFQLISRFISNIEKPMDIPISNALNDSNDKDFKLVENEIHITSQKQHVVNLSVPRSTQLGSHTWSARQRAYNIPKSAKQVVRHSTTNRSQPLGYTEAPSRHHSTHPPKAQRPPPLSRATHVRTTPPKQMRTKNYETTEQKSRRVPPRPKKLPELEEEEEDDYIESEEVLARPRVKRSDDYYDQLDSASSSTQATQETKQTAAKMNCLQFLGSI